MEQRVKPVDRKYAQKVTSSKSTWKAAIENSKRHVDMFIDNRQN